MYNQEFIFFNQTRINEWQGEKELLPTKIRESEQDISLHESIIKPLEAEHNKVAEKMLPLETAISSTKTQLNILQFNQFSDHLIHAFESEEERRRRGYLGSLTEAGIDASRSWQISNLQSELTKLEIRISPFQDQKNDLECKMNSHRSEINALRSNIAFYHRRSDELSKLIADGRVFLNRLRNEPEAFYNGLAGSLIHDLKEYDEKHPAHQSIQVRMCLAELERKINFIRQQIEVDFQQEGVKGNAQKIGQMKVACLCGLLWHTYNQVVGLEINAQIAQIIYSALCDMHILIDGGLPDEMSIGQTCVNLYKNFQDSHFQALRDISKDEFHVVEIQQYHDARHVFQKTLEEKTIPLGNFNSDEWDKLHHVHKQGLALIKKMDDQKNALVKPGEPLPDIKLYTKMLNASTALLNDPSNKSLHMKHKSLAEEDKKGTPTLGQKMGGALLAFLGVVIVAGSILAAVASFGLSAPASAMGVAIGTTAAAKGVSIFTGVVGGGLFGFGLFTAMRKGVSRRMWNFSESVERAPNLLQQDRFVSVESNSSSPITKGEDRPIVISQPSAPPLFDLSTPPPAYSLS